MCYRTLLLNIPGLLIMVSLCCMAGMVLFAWYEHIGCDPLKTGMVENSNQVYPGAIMRQFWKSFDIFV